LDWAADQAHDNRLNQDRDQLGTQGETTSFLRGAQIF